MISDYADEYIMSTEKARKQMIDTLKETHDVSSL
jgi:hypothetical protein